jgi:hypothetical protein
MFMFVFYFLYCKYFKADVHVCCQSRILLNNQTEFIQFYTSSYFSLSNIIYDDARNKHTVIKWKNWRNMTGNKIVRPLFSLNLAPPLYLFFKKMYNFVMQLYKGWKLFMTCKLTILHKMSMPNLLKMRFFYWKQRILVFPHCTHHPKQLFRLSGLNRESYKLTNNRTVRGFYTGVPCGLVWHINLTLTVCLPQF